MTKSENIGEISKSLSAMQGEIVDAIKNAKGARGKYADLPQMLQIVRPLLRKNNLSFTQHPSANELSV